MLKVNGSCRFTVGSLSWPGMQPVKHGALVSQETIMSATETQPRLLTPAEIAAIVKEMRAQMTWKQETLAEFSGLTPRTIQRLEAGEPASSGTRKSVARAFGWPLDFFDTPRIIPTAEDLADQKAAFDREHVVLDVAPVDGRGILTRLADTSGHKAFVHCSLVELSRDGQDAFAAVSDYLQDCLDIIGDMTRVEMLIYGDELTGLAVDLSVAGYELHVASRETKIGNPAWADQTPMPITILYVVAAPARQAIQHIAVKRRITM